ncbi:MAG: replicative DNA helicase, partial [Pirellulales bacterium]|nr:replicative DNA helicase [Pirellulales bacterium]
MATADRIDSKHSSATSGERRSDVLDRLPPQNLDAEKSVLGCMLLDSLICDDVMMILRHEDFYSDANAKLFAQMVEMHSEGKKIDPTLLIERLKTSGELDAIGGVAYLAEVAQSVAVPAHAEHYAEIVRDKSTLRGLIHASSEIIRDAYDSTQEPGELVGQAEQKIFGIHDMRSGGAVAEIHDVLMETFELIDRRVEHGGATGVPTGLHDLDNLTGGLHDSEFVVLAARPSMGKTALALNITENVVIDANVPTLFVSLEMARYELAQRLLSSQGRIDGTKFRSGIMSKDDREKLVEASAKLSAAPLFIDDSPSRSMSEIAAEARRIKRKADLGLIVIDYLQLVQPENPRDPRQEQVAKIARRLKG